MPPGPTTAFGHPRGLIYLTLTEAWERFSFFGTQIVVVLYMVDQLFRPGHNAEILGFSGFRAMLEAVFGAGVAGHLPSAIFGLFGGLAYLTPPIGGVIGDRLLGQRRAVLIAGVLLMAGYMMMAFEYSFLIALFFLIVGSGLIKGNIATQVGALYAKQDRRRADGFLLFYMGDAAGGVIAPLVIGTLGEVYGWHYAFLAATVAITIGMAIYLAGSRYLSTDRWRAWRDGPRPALQPGDLKRVMGLLAIVAMVTSYLIPVNQLGNAYLLWVREYIDRHTLGFQVPVTWLFSFSSMVAIVLPPLLLALGRSAERRGVVIGMLTKLGFGCCLCSGAFVLLAGLAYAASAGLHVSWLWLLLFHLVFAATFLFVWPVGLALFSQAAPVSLGGAVMGAFFLSEFLSNNIVGYLGSLYGSMSPASFWLMHAAIPAIATLVLLIFGRGLARLLAGSPAPSIEASRGFAEA